MKNIYITDLDHTFLRNDLSISDYTKTIWNSFSDNSILSVATARTYRKTMQFLNGVHISAPMILLDGALIATMDKKIIDTKFISKDISDMIIDEGWKFGIYPFVLALADNKTLNESFLHSSILNRHQKEVLTRYIKDDNLQECKNIRAMDENFKIVYMGEEEQLRELAEHLENIFGDDLKYILFEDLVNPKMAEAIGKEAGLETLVFNPGANLTKEDFENNMTFMRLMEENLNSLTVALECHE